MEFLLAFAALIILALIGYCASLSRQVRKGTKREAMLTNELVRVMDTSNASTSSAITLCGTLVEQVLAARTRDVEKYVKAQAATTQLLNEIEATQGGISKEVDELVDRLPPSLESKIKEVHRLCKETRGILQGVTFEELNSLIAQIHQEAENHSSLFSRLRAGLSNPRM